MTARATPLAIAILAIALLAAPALLPSRPLVVWNASASVPRGLYVIASAERLGVGDLVLSAPPEDLAALFAERGYLPRGVALLKHLTALPGAIVCRHGATLSVDGEPRAVAHTHDRAGRELPAWSGCRSVATDELLLLVAHAPDSLDGRYFGPTPRRAVLGRATPLWLTGAR